MTPRASGWSDRSSISCAIRLPGRARSRGSTGAILCWRSRRSSCSMTRFATRSSWCRDRGACHDGMRFTAFRNAAYDSPWWAAPSSREGRFHRAGQDTVQYCSLHPLGPAAEMLRHNVGPDGDPDDVVVESVDRDD